MLKTFFAGTGQTSDVQCHVDGDLLVDPAGKFSSQSCITQSGS